MAQVNQQTAPSDYRTEDYRVPIDKAGGTPASLSYEELQRAGMEHSPDNLSESKKREFLVNAGAIRDAFGGLPQASADWLGRIVTNWQTGAQYLCINDPHKSSVSSGTFTDVTRDDLEISPTAPTPVLDDYWIDTSNWRFFVGVDVRSGVPGWVNDIPSDVFENSVESGRTNVHWMGDYHDHQAALDDLHTLAANTTYFYGNNRDGHVYRLTASTFTAAGDVVNHYTWLLIGGNVRFITSRHQLPDLDQTGKDDNLICLGPDFRLYLVELDLHQGTPNTFTAEDFSATRFDFIGERDSAWFHDNQPTATDHTNRRYGFNTDTEQFVRPFQYGAGSGTNYYTWIATTQDDAPYLGAYDDAADAAPHLRRVGDTYYDRELGQVREVLTFTAGSDEYTSRDWRSVGRTDREILDVLLTTANGLSDTDKATIRSNLGVSGGEDVTTTSATIKAVMVGTDVEMNPLADDGMATGTHGLGAKPDLVKIYAECLTAEHDYEVGDIVLVQESSRITISCDATNVSFSVSGTNANLRIVPETGGDSENATPANWKLVAKSFRFVDQEVLTSASGGGNMAGLELEDVGTNADFTTGDEGNWTDTGIDLPDSYDFLAIRVGVNQVVWFSADQVSDGGVATAGASASTGQGFGHLYVFSRQGSGIITFASSANDDLLIYTDIDDDVNLGEIVVQSATVNASSSQTQEGTTSIGDNLTYVRLYTTEPDGTTPSDPTTLWRFENGFSGSLSPWHESRSDAVDAGNTGDLVWVAVATFRREVTNGITTYHDGDWDVMVEWDVQYSDDDGATWSTSISPDDTHIRFRKEDGTYTKAIPLRNQLDPYVLLSTGFIHRQGDDHRIYPIDWYPPDYASLLFVMEPFASFQNTDSDIPEYFGTAGQAYLHAYGQGFVSTTDDNNNPGTGDQFFMLLDVNSARDASSVVKLGFVPTPAETNFTEATFTRPDNSESDAITTRTWAYFHFVRSDAMDPTSVTHIRFYGIPNTYRRIRLRIYGARHA